MAARTQIDPESQSPLAEVARIVATGLLRRRALEIRIFEPSKISEESASEGLELPAVLPLSVARRTRG
jgi:hypothetical protein